MSRQFTEQEVQAANQAEQQLRAQGLILEVGKEDAAHNSERIVAYFELNKNVPLTVETLLSAVQQMKDQMKWKSGPQMAYEKEYNQLTKAQQDQFGSWWYQKKNVLVLDNDEGYENAAKILTWCRGRNFEARTFDLAVSNLAGSRGLNFVRESSFRGGKHSGSDASFMKKSEVNLSVRDHASRRAADAAAASGTKPSSPDYRALAESITTGRTHSDSLRIQRFYVNKPGSTEIDWEQTYLQRRRIADGKSR